VELDLRPPCGCRQRVRLLAERDQLSSCHCGQWVDLVARNVIIWINHRFVRALIGADARFFAA
jgi:hypothetical protein